MGTAGGSHTEIEPLAGIPVTPEVAHMREMNGAKPALGGTPKGKISNRVYKIDMAFGKIKPNYDRENKQSVPVVAWYVTWDVW